MNDRASHRALWPAGLAVLWIVTVAASYYSANAEYYVGKISVFGRFLLSMLP